MYICIVQCTKMHRAEKFHIETHIFYYKISLTL